MIVHTNKTHVIECDGWEHISYKRYGKEVRRWKCTCGEKTVSYEENRIAEGYYKQTYSGKWTGD